MKSQGLGVCEWKGPKGWFKGVVAHGSGSGRICVKRYGLGVCGYVTACAGDGMWEWWVNARLVEGNTCGSKCGVQ